MMTALILALVLVPLIGAIAALFVGKPRTVTVATGSLTLILSLALTLAYAFGGHTGTLVQLIDVPVMTGLFHFALGIDGLSVIMLLLTGIVTFGACMVTPEKPDRGSANIYHACILFIAAGAVGAFAATDLFFFYAFHELALIPTFLMIGIWGFGEKAERTAVAWRVTIYLALGSFVLLLGLIALYFAVPQDLRTFSMPRMISAVQQHGISPDAQGWIFPLLLVGFGVLISLFPFHNWAPAAYATAPAPVAMLHAGVLKKFGLYGLLRLTVPMLPEAWAQYGLLIQVLLLGNIVYIGLVTIAQKRLGMMLGYSSVMHIGYIFLGLISLNHIGISGAALLIFAHGLSIALLFALNGEIRERAGTLDFDRLGGLAQKMPIVATLFIIGGFASIGLPGFANFASEVLVFLGAFSTEVGGAEISTTAWTSYQITTAIAFWGVVIGAVYMLRAIRRTFFGELPNRYDALPRGATPVYAASGVLLITLFIVGLAPQILLDLLESYLNVLGF